MVNNFKILCSYRELNEDEYIVYHTEIDILDGNYIKQANELDGTISHYKDGWLIITTINNNKEVDGMELYYVGNSSLYSIELLKDGLLRESVLKNIKEYISNN